MDSGKDFAIDDERFKGLSGWVDSAHAVGRKIVPVLKATLTDYPDSPYMTMVHDAEAAISEPGNDFRPLRQKSFTDNEVFLDFFNNASSVIWSRGLGDLSENKSAPGTMLAFDGLWLDGNEPSGYCNGNASDPGAHCQGYDLKPSKTNYNSFWYTSYPDMEKPSTYLLPFIPSDEWNLDNMTVALNATHYRSKLTQYNTHSLFGHQQSKATYEALFTPSDDRMD